MKNLIRGFTLVELMLVVAIIGILVALVIPAYNDYLIRSRISEGLFAATTVKTQITSNANSANALADTVDDWNSQAGGLGLNTKYVRSILADRVTGEITVSFETASVGAAGTLVLTPYLTAGGVTTQLGTALAADNTLGVIYWTCASTSNAVGIANGAPALNLGALEARFAPPECK